MFAFLYLLLKPMESLTTFYLSEEGSVSFIYFEAFSFSFEAKYFL